MFMNTLLIAGVFLWPPNLYFSILSSVWFDDLVQNAQNAQEVKAAIVLGNNTCLYNLWSEKSEQFSTCYNRSTWIAAQGKMSTSDSVLSMRGLM